MDNSVKKNSDIREFIEALVVAVVLAGFIITFIVQSFVVEGRSMEPTLYDGQRLFVNKFIYRFTDIKHGDIVVFRYPLNPAKRYIKRVIGVAGDTIYITDGKVYLNGALLEEDYILEKTKRTWGPYEVPEGRIFVMGDNRNNSDDSRYSDVGFVLKEAVIGKAFVIYWPFSNLKILRSPELDLAKR